MKFEDAKKEAKVSKIPKKVNIKNLKEPNIDTLTYSQAVNTNYKLATSLHVNQALAFGKYFTFVNSVLKPDPEEKKTDFNSLLFTNKKILSVLERIERNMIDEQDTSIKHNSKDSENLYLDRNGADNAGGSNGSGGFGLNLDVPLNVSGNRRGMHGNHKKGPKNKKPKSVNASKESNASKNKKPFSKMSAKEKRAEALKRYRKMHGETNATKFSKDMNLKERETAVKNRANRMQLNHLKRNFVPNTLKFLSRGASIVGTGIIIGEGVYQYINAECAGDRQDAVVSTIGAAGGALAGAKLGAAIGVIGGPVGMAAGALIGAGLGALAGSALGEWISGKFKTPLDLIPDKFKNRGPKVEYAYIETVLIPRMYELPYSSEAEFDKNFGIVERRMEELVEQMKKGSTKEEEREWDKNGLINDNIVTDNWISKNTIKDWKKVENLSDRDFDILINDADLNEQDKDRVREIKFRKDLSNNDDAKSAVSSLDKINEALAAERKRAEEIRKTQNTYDAYGIEIQSNDYRRSLKTIEELQAVKRTMLSHVDKGDYKGILLDEKAKEINKNSGKQFNSLNIMNTSNAEFFAESGQSSKQYSEAWAKSFSNSRDISRGAIADFTSIKAEEIAFNKNDHLGFISGEFESGGNPGVIAKDNIGYAYGAWQMNSRVGLLKPFLETLKGDSRFENLTKLTIDSKEFQNEWARVAKEYPSEFLEKQHQFIEDTKFKPVLNFARSHGLNTTNRAVQEALWSQAVQHGEKGNKIIILNAIKKIGKSNNPQDIVRALYSARSEYINGLSTLDDSLKVQINKRYQQESAKALGVVANSEFQNSDITKNVNNESLETDEIFELNQKLHGNSDKELEEEILNQSNKTSNETDLPVIEVDKVEKRESEMSIEDLNKNVIIIENNVQREKPVENKVERHENPDFAEWSIQTVS